MTVNADTSRQAVMKTRQPEERLAVMIGCSVNPKARTYAGQIMKLGKAKSIQFINLRLPEGTMRTDKHDH